MRPWSSSSCTLHAGAPLLGTASAWRSDWPRNSWRTWRPGRARWSWWAGGFVGGLVGGFVGGLVGFPPPPPPSVRQIFQPVLVSEKSDDHIIFCESSPLRLAKLAGGS